MKRGGSQGRQFNSIWTQRQGILAREWLEAQLSTGDSAASIFFANPVSVSLGGGGLLDTDGLSAQREMLAVLAPVDHCVSSHSLTSMYCHCVHKHTHAWPQT